MTHEALRELAQTDASRALAKELKRRGWTFVGPTTVYAFMQAMGLVNDHLEGCDARPRVEAARDALVRTGSRRIACVSWPWIVLLALGVLVVVAAEWPRVSGVVGADARRRRDRERRKAKLRVVTTDDDDFVESVQRDLDALPTIEEPRSKRP